jgi:hypothetical protein
MRIISDYKELEGKTFTTIKACAEAEAEVDALRKQLDEKNLSKQKKDAADAIDLADKKVRDAYDNYEKVKTEVKKILEESNEKMTSLINTATTTIREAEKERRDAILNYTNKFGTYQKVYTGNRATEEFQRMEKQIASNWGNLVNTFLNL